jgi:hypothetical protein
MKSSYFFQTITKIMTENLQEKKKLLQEVYAKAEKDGSGTSISGVLKYLQVILLHKFRINLNYRTMLGYYKSIVHNDRDATIKAATLDIFSKYLGFDDFNDYREKRGMNFTNPDGNTTVTVTTEGKEKSFSDTVSSIMIIIKNQPIFNVPQMAKNGMGIGAMILVLAASFSFGGNKGMFDKNECMYWDGIEYKITSCDDKNPKHKLIPADTVRLKYFKKITRPDTLTVDNGLGSSWYTKCNNEVEFFTMDGVNPNNGKSLKDASAHMLMKYAGVNAE